MAKNNNVLQLEPNKIQKLNVGVQAPTVRVSNQDISQSVDHLAKTIMNIGGSILENKKIAEDRKRKNLESEEKENLRVYNSVFEIQTKEKINSGYAQIESSKDQFYSDPTTFKNIGKQNHDNYFKAISDTKGLDPETKATLQAQNDKSYRVLEENFRIGLNEYNIKQNKRQVDETVEQSVNNLSNFAYDNNAEATNTELSNLTDSIKLGVKINPEQYTDDNIKQILGTATSKIIEGQVIGSIEKAKDEYDLDTKEGLNGFIGELSNFSANYDSKEIQSFFKETFGDLPYEKENIDKKVYGMIKSQIEQQKYIAENKKVSMEKKTLINIRKDQIEPHNEIRKEGLVYSGEDSNKGLRSNIIKNKTGGKFTGSDIEAGLYAEKNGIEYSLYHTDEMAVFKKELEPFLRIGDSRGALELINKNYEFKVLNRDGDVSFEYDKKMFNNDIIEATGGLIDINYVKAYEEEDDKTITAYEESLRWANKNEYIEDKGVTLNELGDIANVWLPRKIERMQMPWEEDKLVQFNSKLNYLYKNVDDTNQPERLKTLTNNLAFSIFYDDLLYDQNRMDEYNKANKKDKTKMITDFYTKEKNYKKLEEGSKTFSENFLSGNMVKIKTGEMKSEVLVSDKYKNMNFDEIKSNIIQNGNLIFLDPDSNRPYEISSFKLNNNLVVLNTGEDDEIGFFYKDKKHPLSFIENGKYVDAKVKLEEYTKLEKTIGNNNNPKKALKQYEEGRMKMNEEITKEVTKIRNVRNNNPGNLKFANIGWKGELKEKDSGGNVASGNFSKFKTPEYGVRALKKDLTTKINRGLNTIESILNVYAPNGDENNTEAYIEAVEQSVGINRNVPLTTNDMFGLVKAIIAHEGGRKSLLYYNDEVIKKGMEMD